MKIKLLLFCLIVLHSQCNAALPASTIATHSTMIAITAGSMVVKNMNKQKEESMERPEPKKGEIYKHFKGDYYQIICIGHHSETQEKMVVYGKVSKAGMVVAKAVVMINEPCIRPLSMFMSEVDHTKYPDIKQKYRFKKVSQ